MIHFFTKHPTAANLLMVLFLALGVMSLTRLEKETFPDFTDLEVVVTVVYPGATATEIEDAICRRIEDVLEGVSFVDEVVAEAQDNLATVTVAMVEDADFQKFMSDVKTEVESIDDFPDLAETPVIRSRGDKEPVVSIAVTGPMLDADLKTYSEDLKDRLQALEEVSLVTLQGFSQRQLRIEVSAEAMIQLGISPASLTRTIASQSLDFPSGELETGEETVVVRLAEERRSPQELENLVIAGSTTGAEVRLGEIAEIRDLFEDEEEKFVINGERAALIQIQKTASEDALTVFAAVEQFIAAERQRVPQMDLFLTQDLTSITVDRLQMLTKNAWQGLLLVFFTLWLFFNFRLSFWVTMGLPVSFFGAFFLMPFLGISINMITMVGLLLALGLLMDDAIVIAENVATHLRRGENAVRSVVAGVNEVKWGVLSSFLTTICVFGPITTLSGNVGQILRVMPLVLILVLTISMVEAFLILPNHLSHSMKGHEKEGGSRFRQWFDTNLQALREKVLGRSVDWAVRHRFFTVGLTGGVFFLSIALLAGGILKFQAFPSIDGDVVEARLQMPQGTPLHRTEAMAEQLVAAIHEVGADLQTRQPQGVDLVSQVTTQFNTNGATGVRGPHLAKVSVDLLSAEERDGSVDEILRRWREKMGKPTDVVSLIFTEPSLGPTGYPVEIRFFGEDLNQLKAASLDLQQWLDSYLGVRDLQDDLHPGRPEVQISMRDGALALGLTASQLAEQIRGGYQGMAAREIQVSDENFEVEVRFAGQDRNSLPDLETFHVRMPNGGLAPLETVAVVEAAPRSFGSVVRVDGRRTVTIRADLDTDVANVNELLAAFQQDYLPAFHQQFPQLNYAIEGESAEAGETSSSLLRGFQLGLLGIFLLLSFQFRSYREPLIVMAAIPLSLVGVIWGHLLLGYPLTMPSMMGFVSLMGVVVNNSILLAIFIDNRLEEGATPFEAVTGASRDRFRAILLTTLTTVAGLLPLLTEQSMQAQVLIPLAISLIFGLLASTFLVLIVIPCLYLMTGMAEARQARQQASPPVSAQPASA